MKKIISILLVLFSTTIIQAQIKKSFECTYKIIVQDFTESELDKIKDEFMKNRLINKFKELKKREFILKGNLQNAIFKEIERMKSDQDKSLIDVSSNDQFYHDIKSEQVYLFTELDGTKYLASSPFNLYNWEITNETKDIDGFKCYKAKGLEVIDDFRGKENYTLIAWFCPDLPFKYGPEKYFGLPGLIFEAFNENSKEKLVLQSIRFSEEDIEIIKPKGKEMTDIEFTDVFNKTMKRLFQE